MKNECLRLIGESKKNSSDCCKKILDTLKRDLMKAKSPYEYGYIKSLIQRVQKEVI